MYSDGAVYIFYFPNTAKIQSIKLKDESLN